jgi:hypothetical protein
MRFIHRPEPEPSLPKLNAAALRKALDLLWDSTWLIVGDDDLEAQLVAIELAEERAA